MENIYENGPSEIGYGATSLALVMEEMTQGGGSITHTVKHAMPNLLWQAYAGGWLVMYLTDEVHSFIDHDLDRDDTELSYLANSLLTKINEGECPKWILKQLAAETFCRMHAVVQKSETQQPPPLVKPQIQRLNENRRVVCEGEPGDKCRVRFDTPMHYVFDCIDGEMQEYIASKLYDFIITSDGQVETDEEQPLELPVYAFTGQVSDDSLWHELKKQFEENDFYRWGYTCENGGTRTFGVEGVHEGVIVGVRQLIELAMDDATCIDEIPWVMSHGLELPSRLVSSHERSQRALESIS
jgi:hypothetical protein